ncbi:MAG: nitroreductase [Eubacterium sp.]|nr:nitroreductase [Eubacterium sp.]
MDAVTCIKTRRSIREFQKREVSKETIEELVQTAAFAPSWKNTQTTRYIAITDPETKSRLAEQCCAEHNQGIINSTPVLVATTIVDKRSGYERDGSYSTVREDNWQAFDNGIATQTFCLAAHDKGLGTVIMGLYDINKAEEILEIPEGQILMALIAVGYPNQEPAAPKRKPVEDLLTFR